MDRPNCVRLPCPRADVCPVSHGEGGYADLIGANLSCRVQPSVKPQ